MSKMKYMVRFAYHYHMIGNPYQFEEDGYATFDTLDKCKDFMKKYENYDVYSVDYFKLIPRSEPTHLDKYEKDKKYVISFEVTDMYHAVVRYEGPYSLDACYEIIQNYLDEESPYIIGSITWYTPKPIMGRFEWKEN